MNRNRFKLTMLAILAATALSAGPVWSQSSDAVLNAETAYWQSIAADNDADLLRDYLAKVASGAFPGTYKVIAEKRLNTLTTAPVQPQTQTPAQTLAQQGNAAYERGDHKESYRLNSLAAGEGDPQGMMQLAYLLTHGEGTAKDTKLGLWWYDQAAYKGHGPAMTELGVRYAAGNGVEKSVPQALSWLEKGVAAGDPRAMTNLGFLYEDGLGVPADKVKARALYEKAMVAGNLEGAARWLRYHLSNKGTPDDFARAIAVIETEAKKGGPMAMFYAGAFYMNEATGQLDYVKARSWLEKAALAGVPNAMTGMAALYKNGWGVAKDLPTAMDWLQKAAAAGDEDGLLDLAAMYYVGKEVDKDLTKARTLYQKGHDLGIRSMRVKLALMMLKGEGGATNMAQGLSLLKTAAADGDTSATGWLGTVYRWGDYGMAADPEAAFTWWKMGAERGDAYQMSLIARQYVEGQGVAKNNGEALRWAQRSADLGDPDGQVVLGEFYYLTYDPPVAPQDHAKAYTYFNQAAMQQNREGALYLSQLHFNGFGVPKDHDAGLVWARKAAEWGSGPAKTWLKSNGY